MVRLNFFVAEQGCTPAVQAAIVHAVDSEYGGSTTAITSALRALDVWNTPVSALGACVVESTSTSSSAAVPNTKEGADGGHHGR